MGNLDANIKRLQGKLGSTKFALPIEKSEASETTKAELRLIIIIIIIIIINNNKIIFI